MSESFERMKAGLQAKALAVDISGRAEVGAFRKDATSGQAYLEAAAFELVNGVRRIDNGTATWAFKVKVSPEEAKELEALGAKKKHQFVCLTGPWTDQPPLAGKGDRRTTCSRETAWHLRYGDAAARRRHT